MMGAHPISKCGDIHSHSGRINTIQYNAIQKTAILDGVPVVGRSYFRGWRNATPSVTTASDATSRLGTR